MCKYKVHELHQRYRGEDVVYVPCIYMHAR